MKRVLSILSVFCVLFVVSCKEEKLFENVDMQKFGKYRDYVSEEHKYALITNSLRKYSANSPYGLEIVYEHKLVSLKKDGSAIGINDQAIKIISPYMKNYFGELKNGYDSSTETLEYLKASVYVKDKKSAKEIVTDSKTARETTPYNDLFYNEYKLKTLSLKGEEDYCVTRSATKTVYTPNETKGFIYEEYFLANFLPVREFLSVILVEKGADVKIIEQIDSYVTNLEKTNFQLENGDTVYIYRSSNPKMMTFENSTPNYREYISRIQCFNKTSWKDIGVWYENLSRKAIDPANGIIADKVMELTASAKTKEEKIRAIYNWVSKNIRYVSISFNQHSMTPHNAVDVLTNRYGDCKDKSVLLVSMLRGAGFDANLALTTTYQMIDTNMPSCFVFNHCIVAIEKDNGETMYLDPTADNTRYGLIVQAIQNRYALIVGKNGGVLKLIPNDTPDNNQCKSIIGIDFVNPKEANISVKSTLIGGYENERRGADGVSMETLNRNLVQSLSYKYKQVNVITNYFLNIKEDAPLLHNFTYNVKDFAKALGEISQFNPIEGTYTLGGAEMIATTNRIYEIEFMSPWRLIAEITVNLPKDSEIVYIPTNATIQDKNFGAYKYTAEKKGDTVRITRDFNIFRKRIAVSEYPAFKRFYSQCIDMDQQTVLFKPKSK